MVNNNHYEHPLFPEWQRLCGLSIAEFNLNGNSKEHHDLRNKMKTIATTVLKDMYNEQEKRG